MEHGYKIRLVTPDDVAGVLNVYKYYVEKTAITFEYDVPTPEDFGGRIATISPQFPWLVCEWGNNIIGYAYAHKHRDRTAYQWSPEATIYLATGHHGAGIGRVLYEALFAILKLQGFVNLYASVLSSNVNSNAFHRAMGFKEIGLYKNIGFKLGTWHSNMWYELHLVEHPATPATPKPMAAVVTTEAFHEIMKTANKRLRNSPSLAGR